MADVTGPISTLPGATWDPPDGAWCDDHPDRPAVRRVQGETDSFGSEMYDLCQECIDKMRGEVAEERAKPHRCDWCKKEKVGVRPKRDYDEGMSGPVYQVCGDCALEYNRRLEEEEQYNGHLNAYSVGGRHQDPDFD